MFQPTSCNTLRRHLTVLPVCFHQQHIQHMKVPFLLTVDRIVCEWSLIFYHNEFFNRIAILICKKFCLFTSFDSSKIILLFITIVLLITFVQITIIILNTAISMLSTNFASHTMNDSETQHKGMTIGNFNNNNETLLIILFFIYNNYITTIINSITNKTICNEITYQIQTFQKYVIYCNMIFHCYDFGYCKKILIYKKYSVLISFDYNLIILLFIAIVLLVLIITITITIINTRISTILLNFPSVKTTVQHNTSSTITIGYLNNKNITLSVKAMVIYINYIIIIANSIKTNSINQALINKIKLSKHGINGTNYSSRLCFVASSIMLQHSNLWNHYLWNV